MTRPGKSALLFIAIGLTLYAGVYYASEQLLYRTGKTNPFYKIATSERTDFDWAVLGASHAMPLDFSDFNGFMERETGLSIINLAAPGTGPLYNRFVLEQFLAMPEHQRFIRGMIAWIGFRQEAFPYTRDPRFAGVTKYPFHKLVQFAFDAISGFSIKPLRISMVFAIFGTLLAGFLGLLAIWAYFDHKTVSGWASLACIITFFSSMQLICLGVIGEYIGRTYIEVKNRPLFIVKTLLRAK